MAAKKTPASGESAPAGAPAGPSRRERLGADASSAAHARTTATKRAVAATGSRSTHAAGESVVAKSTAGVTPVSHAKHPGHRTDRAGLVVDQQVKSLADIYTPWANVRVNGSGILAIAAWSKRLQEEGKQAIRAAGQELEPFIRGLIHR